MEHLAILKDLVVIFAVAVVVVATLKRVGVPSIAGFVIAGVLVGPGGLQLISNPTEVESLAELGVVLLLFGIGLELSLDRVRRLWRPVLVGGALQMSMTAATAVGIAALFGMPLSHAVFVGFLVSVSSTAIVLRALELRDEIDAPYGRLTIGILVFQDLSVVPMILAIPLLSSGDASMLDLGWAAGSALVVLAGALVAARLLVPRLLRAVARARQRDLFLLALLLVSIGTAWLVSLAGISLGLGAFLAGLVVSTSVFRHQALADLIPFREVFASVFFVAVGMLLNPLHVWDHAGTVIGLLLLIVAGKGVLVALAGTLMRLPLRVSMLAGVALAQVGEFYFVLRHAADGTGLLDPTLAPSLDAAATLSMLVTPALVTLGPKLVAGADKLERFTRMLGVTPACECETDPAAGERHGHVVIGGYGLTGRELAASLRRAGIHHVVLDINPDNVTQAKADGSPAYFGDVTSPDILRHVGVTRARELVLATNDPDGLARSVQAARSVAPDIHIVARTRYLNDTDLLRRSGADQVIPAELEATVEVVSRVLARRGASAEAMATDLERIRGHMS
jgi:CPA2 family monovalent cation:H+ antiporter-2